MSPMYYFLIKIFKKEFILQTASGFLQSMTLNVNTVGLQPTGARGAKLSSVK